MTSHHTCIKHIIFQGQKFYQLWLSIKTTTYIIVISLKIIPIVVTDQAVNFVCLDSLLIQEITNIQTIKFLLQLCINVPFIPLFKSLLILIWL